MKSQYILSLVFLSSLGCMSRLQAQTNTSPYSILGMGDMQMNNFDRSQGMGNTGVSLTSGRYMYLANPASIAGLDNRWFTGEVSANFKNDYYQSNNDTKNYNSNDMQFQKLNFGIKPTKWWGTGFGLKQFSSISYNYSGTTYVNGTDTTLAANYTANGGLNQFFWSNAVNIGKHFSLGVESSYLFGSKQETKTIPAFSIDGIEIADELTIPYTEYYGKLYFKGGLQYHGKISHDLELGLGVTATPKTVLKGRRSLDMISGDPNSEGVTTTLLKDTTLGSSTYTLPAIFEAGFSLKYKDIYTLAFSYQGQQWSKTNNAKALNFNTRDAQRFSGGLEIANRQTAIIAGQPYYYEKSFMQIGGYYNQTYMSVNGQQLNDRGITLGIGFNPAVSSSYTSQLGYMFNLSVGQYGTLQKNLIRQTYFNIGVTITYRDYFRNTTRNIYN